MDSFFLHCESEELSEKSRWWSKIVGVVSFMYESYYKTCDEE